MTDVARQATANPAAPTTPVDLRRTFWLLARLYARRGLNRFTRLGTGRTHTSHVGGERQWARPLLLLAAPHALMLWALSSIVEDVLQAVALHNGPAGAGTGILLTCSACYGLLLLALLRDFDPKRGAVSEEGMWFTTLPAPTWVLYVCKTCEQALIQPAFWLGVFPTLAGLAAFAGWGWLAPLVAIALALPLLVCAGILAGLGGALRARLGHLLWFRVLAWLLPIAAFAALSSLLMVDWGWLPVQELAFAADIRWLPLAEPARVLLAKSSPGALLGWGLAYVIEAGGLVAAGAWALSRIYRAESMGAPLGGRARAARVTRRHSSQSLWLRRLGPVALREALLVKKYPARAARVLLVAATANALALLAPRLGASALMSRPGNVLLNIGTIVVFALSHRLLEKERGALTLLGSLPRPLSSTFAHQTFFIALIAAVLATPAAVYSGRDLPASTAALDIARGLVGIAVVAVVNTALWIRHARDPQPNVWQTWLQPLVVLAAATPIALSGPQHTLACAGQALLVLLLVWDGAAARLARGRDPSQRAPQVSTFRQGVWLALAALVVPTFPDALVAMGGGSPGTRLLVAQGTMAALVGTVLLIELEVDGSIRKAIGAGRGKGVLVSIREGALWAAVASANAWLWLRALPFGATSGSAQPSASDPGAMPADAPGLLLGVSLIVAPLVEETIFRGFLYRALRKHWGVLPCAAASALAFAALHDQAGGLALIGFGLCSALALERSRSLLAPILTHAAYNAFVIGLLG